MRSAVLVLLLFASGCKQTRCTIAPEACLAITVDARDTGTGTTGVRILGFESTCANALTLYCEVGSYSPDLSDGESRPFYWDTSTRGVVADPIGDEEIFVPEGDAFGMTCVRLAPGDAELVSGCVDAVCGDPTAEEVTLEAADETTSCRTAGFFVPFTIAD